MQMTTKNAFTLIGILAIGVAAFSFWSARPSLEGLEPGGAEPGKAVPSTTRKVKIYFTNSTLDPEISCDKVFPVEREIEDTPAVARAALTELLKGPSTTEEEQGYFTSLTPDGGIKSISIEDGVAKVDFDAKFEEGVGGSCRVIAIRKQVEATLLQFPAVKSVIIAVEGRVEDVLQP